MGQEHEDGARREHRGGREGRREGERTPINGKMRKVQRGADKGARITNESFPQKKPVDHYIDDIE